MTLQPNKFKRPPSKAPEAAADAFVGGAPDAKPVRPLRGNKAQITLTIDPDLLDQLDAAAKRMRLSRAALIAFWLNQKLAEEGQ